MSVVDPTVRFSLSARLAFYRLSLPAERRPGRLEQGGTWQALLKNRQAPPPSPFADKERTSTFNNPQTHLVARRLQALEIAAAAPASRRLPYSLLVHAYSTIALRATFEQSSFEPGAEITVTASLLDTNVLPLPLERISMEVARPDGSTLELQLHGIAHHEYQAKFVARTPGVYRCRVRARGRDRQGFPFTRERTLTPAVFYGGNRAQANPLTSGSESRGDAGLLCDLLKCLEVDSALFARRLQELGIDWPKLRRCLLSRCGSHPTPLELARALEIELGRTGAARAARAYAASESAGSYTAPVAPAVDPAARPAAGGAPGGKGDCNC